MSNVDFYNLKLSITNLECALNDGNSQKKIL
jgi:hypothetical protein